VRFAISNIAWASAQDQEVAAEMRAAGAAGVEVAPTAIWPDPLRASADDRREYRDRWRARGLPVVALQSLVFGRPDLQLFDDRTRGELRDRLHGMLEVARDLGAAPLVFGSPRNRTRGALAPGAALEIAVPFFRELGDAAQRLGVVLCVEPNPPAYGCDFITTAAEGRALVDSVASPGFRLHLDAAGMFLAGDVATEEIARGAHLLGHVHLSAPNLGPVGPGAPVDFPAIVKALRTCRYQGLVSIEMRAAPEPAAALANVREALRFVSALVEE
jgi:sugar phosphate isomerase/epimerase